MRRNTDTGPAVDVFTGVEKLLAEGRHEQVLAFLRDPRSGRIRRPFHVDVVRAWLLAGDASYRLGRFRKAQAAFRKVLRHRREHLDALIAMAVCYDDLHKPQLAERYLRRALLIDGTRADALYRLGNALFDQARYFEAASVYRRVPAHATETARRARRNYQMALKLSATS
jgi:tetratricopeptide (TPR) repeat protein